MSRTFEDALDEQLETMKRIILSKRADYGYLNLVKFGEIGFATRAYDKMERLANLLVSGKKPNHESVNDTWVDLANYAIMACIFRNGEIGLPDRKSTGEFDWVIVDDKGNATSDHSGFPNGVLINQESDAPVTVTVQDSDPSAIDRKDYLHRASRG